MTCRDVHEFLDAYCARELAADVRTRFDTHLDGCPSCRDYLRTYRETIRLTRGALRDDGSAASAEVPDELVRAIRRARREE